MKLAVKHIRKRRGFSLIEVLLATFILGIGLIMVATIFPVGADWTRQATESSVAEVIADNAVNVIKGRYSRGGVMAAQVSHITSTLQGLPGLSDPDPNGLNTIHIAERTYQFGNSSPYPAPNPASCTYYWTALARLSPAQISTISPAYDIYILVFRKGEASQTFTNSVSPYRVPADGYAEVSGVRDTADPTFPVMHFNLEPTLLMGTGGTKYSSGTYDTTGTLDPPVKGAIPPIGFYGIGVTSGTVFRQVVSTDVITPSNTKAVARPALMSAGENVIFAPPADGTDASPLVYVFQTTLTF